MIKIAYRNIAKMMMMERQLCAAIGQNRNIARVCCQSCVLCAVSMESRKSAFNVPNTHTHTRSFAVFVCLFAPTESGKNVDSHTEEESILEHT